VTSGERKALERAQATLGTLAATTPRDDAIAFDLRYASRLIDHPFYRAKSTASRRKPPRANPRICRLA